MDLRPSHYTAVDAGLILGRAGDGRSRLASALLALGVGEDVLASYADPAHAPPVQVLSDAIGAAASCADAAAVRAWLERERVDAPHSTCVRRLALVGFDARVVQLLSSAMAQKVHVGCERAVVSMGTGSVGVPGSAAGRTAEIHLGRIMWVVEGDGAEAVRAIPPLPDSVAASLPGMPATTIADHPIRDGDDLVVAAVTQTAIWTEAMLDRA